MDDKLIIFKESEIYFVSGDGPNDLGTGGGFTEPQMLSNDLGCSNKKSIILTPNGLMFKSNKGFYLLDRALQLHYIGADVEKYNNLEITSSVSVDDKNQIRFTHKEGNALVYDYYFNQWSTFTNYDAEDAVNWQNKYTLIKGNGKICVEKSNTYTDDGVGYSLKITTGWMSFATVQGLQFIYKIMLLGDFKSAHDLLVKVAYDYVESFHNDDKKTFQGKAPYQYDVRLRKRKCEAIKLSIEDTSIIGESYNLSNISIEVGQKRGTYKTNSRK